MDTMSAFAMGEANRGKELMVFDWAKAATLIRDRQPSVASAGLQDDWENTGGIIWEDGKPAVDTYTYLASTWATPELDLDGETMDCYKMKSEVPDWGAKTYWPDSARAIVGV